ncbi:MAG TPA: class I SAM-dependent methyltransferase [Planctomycetota bacterium]|nr:class I SAM-dependent methyltransferase [Planctomycetota bacterium]
MVRADAAAGLLLVVTAERLELRSTARGGPGAVFVDFLAGPAGRRLRAATRGGELLARAAGLPTGCRTVLDATAGLGGDACLLALLGAEVTALERHPVVAALLEDGLRRALAAPAFAARLAGRLRVERGDAHAHLARLAAAPPEQRPDVVLIDPMFPELRSAAPRAAMQQFRALVGDDADADSLLPLARACARRRVVVKRPRHAPALGGQPPQVAYRGSSTRFDAYLAQPLPLP